jgi:hypothetical protein
LWVYTRSAEAVTEDSLRAAFGEFTAGGEKTLKITSLGLLKEDDHVSGTGSAAPAGSPEAAAQATDGSSTRPLGWDCCALLEFASYDEAARAYEAQKTRVLRTAPPGEAAPPPAPRKGADKGQREDAGATSAGSSKKAGGKKDDPEGKSGKEEEAEGAADSSDAEPGELEPGEIPSAAAGGGGASEEAKPDAAGKGTEYPGQKQDGPGSDAKAVAAEAAVEVEEEDDENELYLVEWSRLGPLRLPPMPRTAALTRHFRQMPPDFNFTSLGL